ncbi:MAG: response regulator [Verrucomicrobia bacterium]|jgi:CheY-like chemotaxis protein|nr:response regulator [Verrucomicrobiota bacterium]
MFKNHSMDTALKVLVVDDDYVSNIITKTNIDRKLQNTEVITFENSKLALQYILDTLHNVANTPILILLDLYMPVVTGWDILDAIKSSHNLSKLVTLYVLTSSLSEADEAQAMGYDFVSGFISKPFHIESIQEYLNKQA